MRRTSILLLRNAAKSVFNDSLSKPGFLGLQTGFQRRNLSLVIPEGTPDTPVHTSEEVVRQLTEKVIGGPSTYNPDDFAARREALLSIPLPESQDELPPRKMTDSFDQAIIPLGSDLKLRDRYLTHFGSVRIGRLLEDMDIFAVHLVFKFMLNPKQDPESQQSPFSIVTAMVDKIQMKDKIASDEDIKMLGHITWVGKSSVESTLQLHQFRNGQWVHVTSATFVLAVRDPTNKKSSFANPMAEPESDDERQWMERGERNRIQRYSMATDSLFKHPPSEQEKILLHDFFIRTVDHKALSFKARIKPENSVWMEDAKLKNIIICQPEYRNRFNKIFGGFLMRQAFELAWANTYVYSRRRPFIEHMDDILFRKPVDIGSLLYFNSQICFTEDDRIQTRVSAEVLNPRTGQLDLTNVFQYTFSLQSPDAPAPSIIPKTYHEAMMYLEGRRHYLNSVNN